MGQRWSGYVAVALGLALMGPSTGAAAPKTLEALSPADIQPALLLPAPPAEDSARRKAELEELHVIQATRTAQRLELAQWDATHESAGLFAPTLGLKFDLDALPATAKLLAIVENDQSVAASAAKKAFHRRRPWSVDPSLTGCERADKPDPMTSYPSGHTTLGYSVGVVLAALIPDRAADIMARAAEYADSRLVCEAHARADIEAGQALGTAVGVMLLKDPDLRPQIEAARAELKAAGF